MHNKQRCSFRAPRQPRKPVTIVMPPATRSRFAAERDGKDRGREENSDWVKESHTPTPNKPHPPSYTRNVIKKELITTHRLEISNVFQKKSETSKFVRE